MSFGSSANALGNTSFNAAAPKLPPTTNSFKLPLRAAYLCLGGGSCVISSRTGFPTNNALVPKADGNAASTLFANTANVLLVNPAIEFCSCMTKGLPNNLAINPPGKAANPPIPKTTVG